MKVVMNPAFKEYRKAIEARFQALEELRKSETQLIERALEVKNQAHNKALEIQTIELERRLTVLNHAHENAIKEQARVLPRDLFEAHLREYTAWRDSVNGSIAMIGGLKERLSNIDGHFIATASSSANFKDEFDKFKLETATALSVIATRSATWGFVMFVLFSVLTILVAWYK